MTPSLAKRGLWILAASGTFLALGAVNSAPMLTALGATMIIPMLAAYLRFFPTSILLSNRDIEMSWWITAKTGHAGAIEVGSSILLHIRFRNHATRPVRIQNRTIAADPSIEVETNKPIFIPPHSEIEIVLRLRANSCGHHVLQGTTLRMTDIAGLFLISAYFPNPLTITVFPRRYSMHDYRAISPARGSRHEHVGLHQLRRAGFAGELRELRAHSPGDPFKIIAWKATARRQRLMVRDLENNVVLNFHILLDIAGTMREGWRGNTQLDHSVHAAAALASTALEHGDRVGLTTFDTRIFSHLRPAAGRSQQRNILQDLIGSYNVVDEDLTSIADSELVRLVAHYLAYQEAIDVRLEAPPSQDHAWSQVYSGSDGHLYDMGAMTTFVTTLLNQTTTTPSHKRTRAKPSHNSRFARLRSFCHQRGIQLPYSKTHPQGKRAQGLAESLRVCAQHSGASKIIVFTDLHGFAEATKLAMEAVLHLIRARRHVQFVIPYGPFFANQSRSNRSGSPAEVPEQDPIAPAISTLRRHGIPVMLVGPGDGPANLLHRLGKSPRRAA